MKTNCLIFSPLPHHIDRFSKYIIMSCIVPKKITGNSHHMAQCLQWFPCTFIYNTINCLWSQKLCLKRDPEYEACRNWFYSVFNHFRVCWIQCRAVLKYLCKSSNFTIQNWSWKSLENHSKQRCQQVMSQYKIHTCCFICDPSYEAC